MSFAPPRIVPQDSDWSGSPRARDMRRDSAMSKFTHRCAVLRSSPASLGQRVAAHRAYAGSDVLPDAGWWRPTCRRQSRQFHSRIDLLCVHVCHLVRCHGRVAVCGAQINVDTLVLHWGRPRSSAWPRSGIRAGRESVEALLAPRSADWLSACPLAGAVRARAFAPALPLGIVAHPMPQPLVSPIVGTMAARLRCVVRSGGGWRTYWVPQAYKEMSD